MNEQKDIKTLQAEGKGPAPCARFCEATAFRIEIAGLQRRCGHYINQWSEVCNDNLVLINERDAYAAAADTMAAAHKVERDALKAANKDLQDWFDAIKADHNALKDAARMALDALEGIPTSFGNVAYTKDVQAAIAALKAVL